MKSPDQEKGEPESATRNAEKLNKALDAVAKDLAAALDKQSVRTLVKEETGRLLAGQHNVLYRTIASKEVGGNAKASSRTFEQVLAQNRVQSKSSGTNSLERAVSQVREDAAAIPKFDIGVPVNHESWNPEETTPLVAFHHKQQVDDTELERVKAYDAQGNVHWLSTAEAPDQPVVVVGINERTNENGQVAKPYRETVASTDALKIDDGGGGGGGGGGDADSYADEPRDSGDAEYIKQWTCKDNEEPWTAGDAEIYALYIGSSDLDARIESVYLGDGDDGETYRVDQFVVDWGHSEYGEDMGVHWYEADNTDWVETHDLEVLQKNIQIRAWQRC